MDFFLVNFLSEGFTVGGFESVAGSVSCSALTFVFIPELVLSCCEIEQSGY